MTSEDIDHPDHYGGDTDYEVIKVLEAWDLNLAKGFCWGNLIKYTARAGKKDSASEVQDRLKAEWYGHRLATITATLAGQQETAGAEEPASPAYKFRDRDGDLWAWSGAHNGWYLYRFEGVLTHGEGMYATMTLSTDRLRHLWGPLVMVPDQ